MIDFIINAFKIIFLLSFLVLIHEGGHFVVAKMCKIRVNQFAIGFGPTLLKKQGKETLYALRLIPLGGFVSLEGEEEYSDKEGSFSKTTVPKKIAIVLAGGLVNIIFGLIVYFCLVSIISNIYVGFNATVEFAFSIVENLKMLFTGKVGADQLTGPIGISQMVAQTSGIYDFVYLLALISLSLGITNLLPFPPLDGGKVVIYIIEAVRKKPLKENIEINIQLIGFGLMIALSLFVAYNDILRIF